MAARLQPVAPPGSVAVSEMIRRVCEGYFNFRGLGPTAIKGIGEPVEVYEVTGLGTLRTHFDFAAQRGLTTGGGRYRGRVRLESVTFFSPLYLRAAVCRFVMLLKTPMSAFMTPYGTRHQTSYSAFPYPPQK